jgi:protease IV
MQQDHPDHVPPLESAAYSAAGASSVTTTRLSGRTEKLFDDVVQEWMKERRSHRRWKLVWRVLGAVLVAAFVWNLVASFFAGKGSTALPHTALVNVRGEIAAGAEANAESLMAALKAAFEAPGSKAVVLRINSPGGSPVQSGIVNDEIRRLKAKHGKKVYAVVEEMCASGAYYIAVAADEILVDKASLVGSIGVLMDGFGFTGTMDKLGVERRLLTAGENKGMLDPFSPQNDKHNAYARSMINQIHQQFIGVVKQGRGERLKAQADTFSGLFWNGEEAVRLGLADRLGSLDALARDEIKAEEVVDYTQHEHVVERLAKRFGASVGQATAAALRGTAGGAVQLR